MFKIPPLAAMRAFEAVSRLGSVTLAAKELHLTHSAVSHQIKALEDFVGLNLIDRATADDSSIATTPDATPPNGNKPASKLARSMTLTPEGRIYAYQVRLSLQQLANATAHITNRSHTEHITVGMLPSYGAQWLVPRLGDFSARYPHIRLELIASLEVADFDREPLDCTIRFGSITQTGVHSTPLMQDWVCMVAANTDERYSLHMSPQAVTDHGPILQSNEVWSMWAQAAGVDTALPEHNLKFNDSNLSLQAAIQGLGACYTRWSIAAHWVKAGLLQRVTPVLALHQSSYHLMWPPRSHGSEKLAIFSDWLIAQSAAFEQETVAMLAADKPLS